MTDRYDFTVPSLGTPKLDSPIKMSKAMDDFMANYVCDDDRVVYDLHARAGQTVTWEESDLLERTGPREKIYFQPSRVHAGVLTCGGLCPGLNDVVRSIVMCLWHHYGVRRITGLRFGYRSLLPESTVPDFELTPDFVAEIHSRGGTILGSSRGGGNRTEEMADTIERMNINMLFTIGGDGTQKGALALAHELEKRGLKVAIVGIPKTIDNDLSFIERSFGFETAVSKAVEAVASAHTEAHDAPNGVGLVKVMGRESGFIAANTALAMNDVNYVLIPEVPFELDGANGLLVHLEKRLAARNHAVVLVAEGAGQDLFEQTSLTDESGNKKLGDIGLLLKKRISAHFKDKGNPVSLKYIDPSYIIRSTPANPSDSIYCTRLGTDAVHAAMAGKTRVLMGLVNYHLVHIPMAAAVSKRNFVDPESSLWRDVVEATGQPALMTNR